MPDDTYCRDAAAEVGEQIEGSAVESTWSWLLLEHPGPWESKAVPGLPPVLREPLLAAEAQIPGCRVQLIRRDGADTKRAPVLMWGDSRPGHTWLRRMHLDHLDALAALDLPSLFRDPGLGEPVRRPVLLVCTHGKRDRCCAKYGLEMYRALLPDSRVEVWQTTHLGGHRFAATLVELPTGLCYGRLDPGDAPGLVEAVTEGLLYRLDRFRGRTAFDRAAQAAEHAIRGRLGEMDHGSLPLLDSAEVGGVGIVRFRGARGPIEVRVASSAGPLRPPSCHKEPTAVIRLTIT